MSNREIKVKCSVCGHMTRIPTVTNADRIRAMSDEELAETLRDIVFDSVRTLMFTHESRGIKEWLDWLQQEVSE